MSFLWMLPTVAAPPARALNNSSICQWTFVSFLWMLPAVATPLFWMLLFRDLPVVQQLLSCTPSFSGYTQPIWTSKVSRSMCSLRPFVCP
jgi:hypothetical protein